MKDQIHGAEQPYKQSSTSETGQEGPEKAQKGAKEGETIPQAGVDIPEEKKIDSEAFSEVKVGDVWEWPDRGTFTIDRVGETIADISWKGTEGDTYHGSLPLKYIQTLKRVYSAPPTEELSTDAPEPAQPAATLNQAQPKQGDTVWIPMVFVHDDGANFLPWQLKQEGERNHGIFCRPERWHVGENLPVPSGEHTAIMRELEQAVRRALASKQHLASAADGIIKHLNSAEVVAWQLLQLGREFGKKENEQ